MAVDPKQDLSRETWRIFRIIGEFVDGFETLSNIDRAVTIFGSARTKPGGEYYEKAVECARLFAETGFSVITGGGPGIMEAANKGAAEVEGAHSVGLNIALPMEQEGNPYQNIALDFRYFFVRKVMFVKYASGFVIFPGGYGTMDEFFESMTLIQTLKIDPFPVVLIGHDYWDGLVAWMKDVMLESYRCISSPDLELFHVTDDVAEAVQIVSRCYNDKCWLGPPPPDISREAAEPTAEGTRTGYLASPRTRRPPIG